MKMTTPIWSIAVGAAPTVIDLSHNNSNLNTQAEFNALYSAGVRVVIHKATQGISFIDPMFAVRRPLAVMAGLKWDAYHFCTSDPIAEQQAFFLSHAGVDLTKMRLALDAEPNRGSTIDPAQAAAFAKSLDTKLKRQVLRYGNSCVLEYKQLDWYNGPMWWAKYGLEPTVEQFKALGVDPSKVVLWQETGSGRIAGETPVDLSYAKFDVATWPNISGF
jgi:GH25 family lysozyme M1 (1,4-beta-N-acetylmuramidase)